MPQQQSPWLEGAYGWSFGESGWNYGMDSNLLKFSFMFDRNVDGIVSSLPPAVNGQAYYLTTDNRLYFVVEGAYLSSPTPKWFIIALRSTGQLYQFNGQSLVAVKNSSEVEADLEAIELTLSNLGSAAYQDESYFAKTAELDVAEANSASYTDSQFERLGSSEPGQGSALVAKSAQTVDNVEALRLLISSSASKYAFVSGYYSQGDGGGGSYYLDESDTTSADNGGTIIVANDGGRWKLIQKGRISLHQFGAIGDGVTDDTARIQAAIDSGFPLYAQAGVYILTLGQPITLEAGSTVCALVAQSGMNIVGDGMGRSVFKIKDNESTDANPKFFNMIASNQALSYIYLEGITFDLNGQNNKISPNRGSDSYNPYNCAALMVSGSVATGGADASVSHSKILRCEVINSPGVTGIALGQRYGHSGVKGRNVEIAHCRFYNNGIDSADHSSIYGFADGLSVHDCEFDHPVPSTGKLGPVCCIESFGSGNKIYGNRVRNYLQFCWIGCGEEGQHSDIQVFGNNGRVAFRVVDTWSFGPQDDGLSDIQIFGNQFTITADALGTPGLDRVAVNLAMGVADLFRVNVSCNKFVCEDRSSNVGIVISADTGHSIGNVAVFGNDISGFSRGIAGGGNGQLIDVSINQNKISDCRATTSRPTDTRGVDFSGANPFATLRIYGNDITGADLYANPLYGIVVSGSFGSLHVDSNVIRAATDLAITASVSGRRTGRQALMFDALPIDGTWQAGDEIFNSNRVELGTVGSKYVIDGWVYTAGGWLQRRTLTGN